jgi:hypothetical protein
MFLKKPETAAAPIVAPTLEYVLVTPAMAQEWLLANDNNRTLRQQKVHQYARDMAEGRWTLGADMICFAADGRLLNGQHRLNAVIISGCTVMFAVQHNTPPESMANMDTGASRKAGDFLNWAGESNGPLLASAAKLASLWVSGRIYKDNKQQGVSHSEIRDFVAGHPDIRYSTNFINRHRNIDIKPTPLVVAHWGIGRAAGEPAADTFVERLSSLVGEPRGSAVLALNSRLREMRRQKVDRPNRELLALVIKAWNYDVSGRPVASLTVTQRGAFKIPTPDAPSNTNL